MYAAAGQGNDHIAGCHGAVVQDLALIHCAHGKAGQVVFILGVEAGHFGGFAAHQCAAGLHAALGHALDQIGDLFGHILAAGNVIQKYQRLGTGADHIVHAHGHTVDAHGVVLVHDHGNAQLGAHAVGAADQHRMGHIGAVQLKQAAKAAKAADAMLVGGAGHILFHKFHCAITGGNVHTGGSVACRIALFHDKLPPVFCWLYINL